MTLPLVYASISVTQLAQRLATNTEVLQLLDVREPQEERLAAIPGFQLFPLSQFQQWADQLVAKLDPNKEIIVLCHHGIRSAQMCQWLVQQGFTQVSNVVGGIDEYSITVDATIPRY